MLRVSVHPRHLSKDKVTVTRVEGDDDGPWCSNDDGNCGAYATFVVGTGKFRFLTCDAHLALALNEEIG